MAENIKVFELAKELNIKALELIDKVRPLDLKLKNHMAELTAAQVEQIKNFLNPPAAAEAPKKIVTRKKATPAPAAAAAAPAPAAATKVVRRRAASDEAAVEETPAAESAPVETGADSAAETLEPAYEAPAAVVDEPVAAAPAEISTPAEESVEVAASAAEAAAPEALDAVAPAEGAAPASPAAAPAAPPRRGPRYSVIRVVSAETTRARPLIVEEAKPGSENIGRKPPRPGVGAAGTVSVSISPRDFAEEEERKKKASPAPRKTGDEQSFKSTDYLRRERVYQAKKKRLSIGIAQKKTQVTQAAAHKRRVDYDTRITVEGLGEQMAIKAVEIAKKLRGLGVEQPDESENFGDWYIDIETAQLVAAEFGFEIRDVSFDEDEILSADVPEGEEGEPRSPVVTIMGHVDHGKTSLLDIIRRSRVVSGEAGGITQHIGAYTVTVADAIKNLQAAAALAAGDKKKLKEEKKAAKKEGGKKAAASDVDALKRITFLDTPGHAAFTSMRARGAKVTDIVILVVAASEGVMPQTREAADHAKAAGVPIIVAMNKMDLPDANPDKIKQQLSEVGILSEEWGGETIFVPVSAKTGMGVDQLLEMIQLQAEVLDLKARADGPGEGNIVEAKLDKGRGAVATVLVRAGQVKVGDYIVAGTQAGKVRALIDDKGVQTKVAGPSTPVEVLGLSGVPEAGDQLNVVADERAAKALAEHRELLKKGEATSRGARLEDIMAMMEGSSSRELPVILKADVKGSAEAIQAALMKLPQTKVKLKILSAATGGITESDVLLASASKALILGFNVRPDNKAQGEADSRGVQIRSYSIIYELIDEVTKAMEGLLDPVSKETVMGRAEVRNVFNITKIGTVAGCFIVKGKVQRSNQARLIRDGRVIYTGKLSGLKRFKDDAREVAEGYECGISIENYNDIKEGDVIEAFTVENVTATLADGPTASA
jgi:translation initiation factor IF-2